MERTKTHPIFLLIVCAFLLLFLSACRETASSTLTEIDYGEFRIISGAPALEQRYENFDRGLYDRNLTGVSKPQIDLSEAQKLWDQVTLTPTTVPEDDLWEAIRLPLKEEIIFGFSFADDRCLAYNCADGSYWEASGYDALLRLADGAMWTDRYRVPYWANTVREMIDTEDGNRIYLTGVMKQKRFFHSDSPRIDPSAVWFLQDGEKADLADPIALSASAARIAHFENDYCTWIYSDPYTGGVSVHIFVTNPLDQTEDKIPDSWIYGDEMIVVFSADGTPLRVCARIPRSDTTYAIPPDFDGRVKRW